MVKAMHFLVKNRRMVFFLNMVLLAGMMAPANAVLKAKWRYSSATTKWVAEAQLTIVASGAATTYVDLDTVVKYQTIDGWGGSPNEVGTNALSRLPAALQDTVVKYLFDSVTGCKFNMIRLPIGCSDFSLGGYTLNDNANDTLMTRISIARDTGGTIKFVKSAMRYCPGLRVWGSPWSAPIWMKNNNNWWGGGANTDECAVMQTPKILTAYALYFSKAVQLYQAAGVPFFALSFQNEPRVCQPFPSTRWSGGATMENFMRNYLYPRMHADHPEVELWTPTMNVADHTYFSPMLDDATTNLAAACFQYEGIDAIAWVHTTYPRIKKYATELRCGDGSNQWSYPLTQTFPDIKFYITNGAGGAFQWNLILEPNGASGPMVNFRQNCMITMDTVAKTITCQPQYYALKHFSYYLRPGSRVIGLAGNYAANVVAVKNPNGSVGVTALNANTAAAQVSIRFFGNQMVTASLPASSFSSFLIYDSLTTGVSQALVSPENNSSGAGVSFKVTGEKFILPAAYAGKSCMCSVFDIKGKLIRKLSTKNQTISLSKFGIPEGVYVVRIKTVI
jgi:glucosylceramidase